MRRFGTVAAVLVLAAGARLPAQTATREYQVKAAYIYNFLKFVEWPTDATSGALTVCIAGRNPFGTVLGDTLRGETIGGRMVVDRIILEPEPGCHVIFIPQGSSFEAYLRATRGTSTLTIGEIPPFIARGGIINFYREGSSIRFEINPEAAEKARLRISSRLLQLARITTPPATR